MVLNLLCLFPGRMGIVVVCMSSMDGWMNEVLTMQWIDSVWQEDLIYISSGSWASGVWDSAQLLSFSGL